MKLLTLSGSMCLLLAVGAVVPVHAQAPGSVPFRRSAAVAVERNAEPPEVSRPNPPPSDPEANAPAKPAGSATINSAAGDYVLSKDDTLEMTVYREPDLTTRSHVATDGTVELPLIGDVKVAGLPVREARELIRKLYDRDYIVNPQVYLNVIEYGERKFTILGQIAKPGTYNFPGGKPLTLLEAVGIAGGFLRTADRSKITVSRTTENKQDESIRVNAKKMTSGGASAFDLRPGDIITVNESWF